MENLQKFFEEVYSNSICYELENIIYETKKVRENLILLRFCENQKFNLKQRAFNSYLSDVTTNLGSFQDA